MTADIVYRSDQVGSLLRPSQLLDARDAYKAGTIDRAALRAAEDVAVLEALQVQKNAGMTIFTDGEMRRDPGKQSLAKRSKALRKNIPSARSNGPTEPRPGCRCTPRRSSAR